VKYRQWGEGLEHEAVMQMEKACLLPVAVAGALMLAPTDAPARIAEFDAQPHMINIHSVHPGNTSAKTICHIVKTTIVRLLVVGALCLGLSPRTNRRPKESATCRDVGDGLDQVRRCQDFTPIGDDLKALKFITPTHFIWTHFDPKTKKIGNSMGGTYTCEGDTYIETPQFAYEGMETYLGKAQKFTVKIEGDKLTQSGELSDGLKIQEIWKRVK